MINMDMVGRLRADKLQVLGVGTAPGLPAMVTAANAAVGGPAGAGGGARGGGYARWPHATGVLGYSDTGAACG